GEKHKTTSDNLKEKVRSMIPKETSMENLLSTLQLVDDLQRLGISYHFKDEISNVLNMIYGCYYESCENWNKMNLNLKALGFRLLRQHGYHIPQEIFEDIKDESGSIKDNVCADVVGMLNLYEASFYAIHEENILDETRELTRKCLREELEKNNIVNKSTRMLISHALELPLLWRLPRFESTWFIEAYKERSDMIPLLLEFAKLDYNILQGVHQEDLKHISRYAILYVFLVVLVFGFPYLVCHIIILNIHLVIWWAGLYWNQKLEFARDRMVENDMYDVYGTLDELERFTEVVRRWDLNAVEELPEYMKLCFLGLNNTINEMGYHTLTNQGSFVIPYVQKVVYMECASNLGRMGQFTYERGDIFGAPDDVYKNHLSALLFDPKS
ncbi:hypothetical protein M8C21_011235, partial [Ambrosia artemisiifolia]